MNRLGGFKTQGRELTGRAVVMRDAKAVAEAGAFSVVLEGIVEDLAADITNSIAIPTIGIGASAACDGQVLVVDDMLGMFERSPRFVKQYASLRNTIAAAAADYAAEVRAGRFPDAAHCYGTVKKSSA
jgi:3-methyl-2-oxobutanoate hydroxymethyltransferase